MVRRLFLPLALLCASPALAGYSGTPAGGAAVTMSGDVTGQSSGTTVSGLNGSAIGGDCPTGQSPNGITNTAAPKNCFTIAASVVPFHVGYRTGLFYAPLGSITEATSGTPAAINTAYCTPGSVGGTAAVKLKELVSRITTAGTTTYTTAVYENGFSTGRAAPEGAPIGTTAQTANTSTATTATSTLGINILALTGGPFAVSPGLKWWCIEQGDTTDRYTAKGDAQAEQTIGQVNAATASSGGDRGLSTTVASYGTWPTFGSSTTWADIGNIAPSIRFTVSP